MNNTEKMELIKFCAQHRISGDLINETVDVQRVLDEFLVTQYGRFLGRRSTTYTIHHPLTLWDHFKESAFPEWLLARYPAEQKVHNFDLVAIFPELTKKVAKEHPVFDVSHYTYSTEEFR